MEGLLCFVRGDVPNGAVQPGVVIPVDPFEGFPLDLADGFPGAEELDGLGLEEAHDAFGEGIVIGIPDAADRSVDTGLSVTLELSRNGGGLAP